MNEQELSQSCLGCLVVLALFLICSVIYSMASAQVVASRAKGTRAGRASGEIVRLKRATEIAYWDQILKSSEANTHPVYHVLYGGLAFLTTFLLQYGCHFSCGGLGLYKT